MSFKRRKKSANLRKQPILQKGDNVLLALKSAEECAKKSNENCKLLTSEEIKELIEKEINEGTRYVEKFVYEHNKNIRLRINW